MLLLGKEGQCAARERTKCCDSDAERVPGDVTAEIFLGDTMAMAGFTDS